MKRLVLTAWLIVISLAIIFGISSCGQSEPSTDNRLSSESSSDATAEPEPTPEPQMQTIWYVKYQDDIGWLSERLTPDINCEIKDSSLVIITYPDGKKKYIGGNFVITTKEEVVAQ